MQFAPIAPVRFTAAADDPRVAAGTALKQATMAVPAVASMTIMSAAMSGKTSLTPAELVAQVPADKLAEGFQQALDGVVAAAPELAAQRPALDQAAQGVLTWLKTQAADTTTQLSLAKDSQDVNNWFGSYMAAGAQALLATASTLAPDEPAPAPVR